LFYVSYLLIKSDKNLFWQLLFATILSEIIEKFLKRKSYWPRPFHLRSHKVPHGLFKSWYQIGSFPSGHAMKVTFFLLLLIQNPISITPVQFLLVTVPLVFLRVILGFHYIIDIIGGIFFGILIWLSVRHIVLPPSLTQFISTIFNAVFFIK
jgi:membrane-associated phospholipid phosphatase